MFKNDTSNNIVYINYSNSAVNPTIYETSIKTDSLMNIIKDSIIVIDCEKLVNTPLQSVIE